MVYFIAVLPLYNTLCYVLHGVVLRLATQVLWACLFIFSICIVQILLSFILSAKLMMTLSKWREQMLENASHALHESNRDDESTARKTVTTTGDIRSCLDDDSVYSVRKMVVFFF